MKKILTFSSAFAILFCITFFGCQFPEDQSRTGFGRKKSKLEAKLGPSENSFAMRAYPDQTLDVDAYKTALISLSENVQSRTTQPGFDLEWVTQGPGNIGARVNNLAVDPQDEAIMYAGFSHGGIFKTEDGGLSWKPIFDDQPFLSIGHIAIDPTDSETIYVGTGDVNIPGGYFIGNGIYKSTDGGDIWQNIGLKDHGIISKVVVDPNNAQTVYAGTMGVPGKTDINRGLYKSTDGGQTWQRILFIAQNAGVIDFDLDPSDSQTIIAASWDRFRSDFVSVIAGENSKLWKSTNAGNDWTELSNGLPDENEMGRIGITHSASASGVLYSVFVSDRSQLYGIYKSTDNGDNWTEVIDFERFDEEVNGSPLGGFGWYFGKIRVNPLDENDIYLLGVDLWRSRDAGQTWERATPVWWEYSVHADKHDLDFTPSGNMILSTDGGIYKFDQITEEWSDIENIPATQFYRVAYNPHNSDWYYGGAQDNGTTGGNQFDINGWERLNGADGFQPAFHPTNPDVYYFETQNGGITGTNNGGDSFFGADDGLRGETRNWDMPYFISPNNPDILYAGGTKLFRSDAGAIPEFEPVTDLLTSVDGSSNFTISTIDESPIIFGQVYVGTTEGRVYRTQFNGTTSDTVNISEGLPVRYVTSIKASPTKANTVFVTHSGYRANEYTPHVHRSDDGGSTWTDISQNLPEIAVNDIFIIPNTGDSILFVASDGGVYGTVNAGEEWHRLGINMPIIPVQDMDFNVVKQEIVAATYARSIMTYNIEDILNTDVSSSSEPTFVEKQAFVKVFPNPSSDFINIEFQNIEPNRPAEIVIINNKGQLMYQQQVDQSGKISHQVDISDFPFGKYFTKVKLRHLVKSAAFIKS